MNYTSTYIENNNNYENEKLMMGIYDQHIVLRDYYLYREIAQEILDEFRI